MYTFRYICTAYDVDGIRTTAEAYLEIRDICAGNDCQSPQVKRTIKHVQKTVHTLKGNGLYPVGVYLLDLAPRNNNLYSWLIHNRLIPCMRTG